MIDYVACFAHIGTGHSLPMLVKDRPEYLKGTLMLPGGKVEPGEFVDAAAIRELKEETGLVAVSSRIMGLVRGKEKAIWVVKLWVQDAELSPRSEETEKPFWVNPRTVLEDERLMPNLRLVFPLVWTDHKDWMIIDDSGGSWRYNERHEVKLVLNRYDPDTTVSVVVRGMGRKEEEQ
jgi:8-oxo-dGTP pyrophosphatase MutT (NUDIX family)